MEVPQLADCFPSGYLTFMRSNEVRADLVVPMRGSSGVVLAIVETELGAWASTLEAVTSAALGGDLLAIRTYATTYRDLVRFVHLQLDPKLEHPEASRVALREATVAPMRSRTPHGKGIGVGIALWVVSVIRDVLPNDDPLLMPTGWPHALRQDLDREKVELFDRLVDTIVDRELAGFPLDEIQAVFDLNATELAGLFGVERQAISQWRERGTPPARRAKVTTVAEVATILRQRLRPGSVPGVVRKPADAYGHRSMLEMIAQDDQDDLLAITKRSFDWTTTA